jgi:hypothetical protein
VGRRRAPRGPDPIARWLGDDQRKPPPGRFRYEDSEEFLRELDDVISPTFAFEYDGRYAQSYTVESSTPERPLGSRYLAELERAAADYRWRGVRTGRLPRARSTPWRRPLEFVEELGRARDAVRAATDGVSITLTVDFSRLSEGLRAAILAVADVRRAFGFDDVIGSIDDPPTAARWADDGGAIGPVDY